AVVDAFDLFFQRSLEDMVSTYQELAAPSAAHSGVWPVVIGGEMNCYPFPHNGSFRIHRTKPAKGNFNTTWVHRVPSSAFLKLNAEAKDARAAVQYPATDKSGSIASTEVCEEVLRQFPADSVPAHSRAFFPFVNGGALVGPASTIL
ncbi:unnamed protein product, partial [Symbiodinium pilosum]